MEYKEANPGQDAVKWYQKDSPRPPKEHQTGAKFMPKRAKMLPKVTQNAPKANQKGIKLMPKRVKIRKMTHRGKSLNSLKILDQFGVPARVHFRSKI